MSKPRKVAPGPLSVFLWDDQPHRKTGKPRRRLRRTRSGVMKYAGEAASHRIRRRARAIPGFSRYVILADGHVYAIFTRRAVVTDRPLDPDKWRRIKASRAVGRGLSSRYRDTTRKVKLMHDDGFQRTRSILTLIDQTFGHKHGDKARRLLAARELLRMPLTRLDRRLLRTVGRLSPYRTNRGGAAPAKTD